MTIPLFVIFLCTASYCQPGWPTPFQSAAACHEQETKIAALFASNPNIKIRCLERRPQWSDAEVGQ